MCTNLRVACLSSDELDSISVVYYILVICDRASYWTSIACVSIWSGSLVAKIFCLAGFREYHRIVVVCHRLTVLRLSPVWLSCVRASVNRASSGKFLPSFVSRARASLGAACASPGRVSCVLCRARRHARYLVGCRAGLMRSCCKTDYI